MMSVLHVRCHCFKYYCNNSSSMTSGHCVLPWDNAIDHSMAQVLTSDKLSHYCKAIKLKQVAQIFCHYSVNWHIFYNETAGQCWAHGPSHPKLHILIAILGNAYSRPMLIVAKWHCRSGSQRVSLDIAGNLTDFNEAQKSAGLPELPRVTLSGMGEHWITRQWLVAWWW